MPTKRPIFLYSLLATLFAVTLLYQVFYFPDFVRREAKHVPSFFVEPGSNRIAFASAEAPAHGIHDGDGLLAVNGVPYTGTGILGRAFRSLQVGVPLVVTVVPKNAPVGAQQTIPLPVTAARFSSWDTATDLAVEFFLPVVSLLLGFWVAFRRPRDPLAWLLLALMLSFPHILRTFVVQGWAPGWRVAGVLYETTLEAAFPIVIYLFGRFFPEPFPRRSGYDKSWRALQWLCALPFAVLGLAGVAVTVGELSNYQSVAALGNVLNAFRIVEEVCGFILVGSFFSAMGIKHGLSQSPDAKRRLRLLNWGTTVAFTPVLLASLYSRLQSKTPDQLFPSWFIALILIPLLLFPLTLSYIIVVQKAMGVGVALRQGLQYTLARGGIRVLQFLAIGAVIVAGMTMAENASHDRAQKTIVIVAGITAYFTIRRLGGRLAHLGRSPFLPRKLQRRTRVDRVERAGAVDH